MLGAKLAARRANSSADIFHHQVDLFNVDRPGRVEPGLHVEMLAQRVHIVYARPPDAAFSLRWNRVVPAGKCRLIDGQLEIVAQTRPGHDLPAEVRPAKHPNRLDEFINPRRWIIISETRNLDIVQKDFPAGDANKTHQGLELRIQRLSRLGCRELAPKIIQSLVTFPLAGQGNIL